MRKNSYRLVLTLTFIVASLVTLSEVSNLALFDFFSTNERVASHSSASYSFKWHRLEYKSETLATFKTQIEEAPISV